MSACRLSQLHHFIPLFGLLVLGACDQDTLGPADPLAPSFAKAKDPSSVCSRFVGDIHQPVMADGLPHFPIRKAMLSVGEDGNLVISNLRRNGNSGACTELPMVGGVAVEYSNPSFGDTPGLNGGEITQALYAQNGTRAYQTGLRFSSGQDSRMDGHLKYPGDCAVTVVVRRNGAVLRSRTGTGRIRFMLPGDFRLGEWSFKDGIGMLRGNDGENTWSVTGTPDVACRATPKLVAAINLITAGTIGRSVTLSWATFPSGG